jgi:hypothetical protein
MPNSQYMNALVEMELINDPDGIIDVFRGYYLIINNDLDNAFVFMNVLTNTPLTVVDQTYEFEVSPNYFNESMTDDFHQVRGNIFINNNLNPELHRLANNGCTKTNVPWQNIYSWNSQLKLKELKDADIHPVHSIIAGDNISVDRSDVIVQVTDDNVPVVPDSERRLLTVRNQIKLWK